MVHRVGATRGLRIGIAGLCACALAVAGGPFTESSTAGGGYPGLDYVSMKKKAHGPPRKRFVLRLFTTYTHPHAGDRVSAQKGHGEVFAPFHGRNKNPRFHEWWITHNTDKGPRLIHRIRKALQRHGHARFFGYVYPHGATGPFRFKCRLNGFNNLGNCRSIVTTL
jgi:hypothetical protein